MIQYNGWPYIKIEDLWKALYQTFNLAQNWQVNMSLLKELSFKLYLLWNLFLREKFMMAINKYNNLSTFGPDKISSI